MASVVNRSNNTERFNAPTWTASVRRSADSCGRNLPKTEATSRRVTSANELTW